MKWLPSVILFLCLLSSACHVESPARQPNALRPIVLPGDHLKAGNSTLADATGYAAKLVARPTLNFTATVEQGTPHALHTTGSEALAGHAEGPDTRLRDDYVFDVLSNNLCVNRYGDGRTDKHVIQLKTSGGVVVVPVDVHSAFNLARRFANADDFVVLDVTTMPAGADRAADPPKRELWRLKVKQIEDCLNRAW